MHSSAIRLLGDISMSAIAMSQHARVRMQQRGIPEDVLLLLFQFGEKEYDHRGAAVMYLTRGSREKLLRAIGKEQAHRLERALNVYAVVDIDGYVVTVGHRTRRINRQ